LEQTVDQDVEFGALDVGGRGNRGMYLRREGIGWGFTHDFPPFLLFIGIRFGDYRMFKFGFIELFVVGVLPLFGQGSKGDAVPLG
jgi:hypothetical protein